MAKEYLNAFMNNSATIREVAGAEIKNAAHKAVAYNANGKVILPASAGAVAVGFILSDTLDLAEGDETNILIKDIGLGEASAAIAKGAAVTVTTAGTLATAASGNFILGFAMTAASAAGELVQVQLTKSGYAK